jgi:hypothetical protein
VITYTQNVWDTRSNGEVNFENINLIKLGIFIAANLIGYHFWIVVYSNYKLIKKQNRISALADIYSRNVLNQSQSILETETRIPQRPLFLRTNSLPDYEVVMSEEEIVEKVETPPPNYDEICFVTVSES